MEVLLRIKGVVTRNTTDYETDIIHYAEFIIFFKLAAVQIIIYALSPPLFRNLIFGGLQFDNWVPFLFLA